MDAGMTDAIKLVFFGIGALRETIKCKERQIKTLGLGKLTTARVLVSKSAVIDNWKQLYLALASGKVQKHVLRSWLPELIEKTSGWAQVSRK